MPRNHEMPDALDFKVMTESVKYGDGRTFVEYRILIFHRGEAVGIEEGPRRNTVDRGAAARAARQRISALKKRRLFAIRVTRKHISDGDARQCNTCAIAQALWHNQERMGFSKHEYAFEVSPYGCFTTPRGLVLRKKYGDDISAIPADKLPEIFVGTLNKRHYSEGMAEWAMYFDDWAESRFMSAAEWREERDADGKPGRPGPCSFVLDLDAFTDVIDA